MYESVPVGGLVAYLVGSLGSMLCICQSKMGSVCFPLERCFEALEFSCVIDGYGFPPTRKEPYLILYIHVYQ